MFHLSRHMWGYSCKQFSYHLQYWPGQNMTGSRWNHSEVKSGTKTYHKETKTKAECMSPMIFAVMFTKIFILAELAEHNGVSSAAPALSHPERPQTPRSCPAWPRPPSDWLEQLGVSSLSLQGHHDAFKEGTALLIHFPQSGFFFFFCPKAVENRSVMTQLLAPSTPSVVMM